MMNARMGFLGRVGVFCFALFLVGFAAVAELRAGAASTSVSPPAGVCLAGYDQNRRSTGVHDDLFAKAVVLDDGKMQLALVVVDCIGIQYDTANAIRAKAAAQVPGLAPEHVIVVSTHTHCGPDVIGIYGPDESHTGRDTGYIDSLITAAAAQVARAAKRLEPVQAFWAETVCAGWAVNDSEPALIDNSVTILQFRNAKGKSLATWTNFACHPTVLDGNTTEVSADWVGEFYRVMSMALPGEHLFLQGAIGCWIQPKTPVRTFALAAQYGTDLASKTLDALKNAKPLASSGLRFARKVFGVPLAEDSPYRLFSQMGLVSRPITDSVQTEVAWFSIGPAQFATHPGETAPMYAAKTKELMDSGPKFVLGLGLDELGYFCPPFYFDNPQQVPCAPYLTRMSPGKAAGDALTAALAAAIPHVDSGRKP